MVFSGEPIDARRALTLGLVHRVVPASELDDAARAAAEALAARDQAPLRAAKEAMLRGDELPLEEGLRLESAIAARVVLDSSE
jgi:enoyl-CoA hydratase/carnithine racemase